MLLMWAGSEAANHYTARRVVRPVPAKRSRDYPSPRTAVRTTHGSKVRPRVMHRAAERQPPVTVPWDLDTYLQDGMRLVRVIAYDKDEATKKPVVILENCYSEKDETEVMTVEEAEKKFKSVKPQRVQ